MKNSKKFLIICAVLTVVGIAMSVVGVAMGGVVHNVSLNAHGLHVSAPALQDELPRNNEKNETVDAFSSMEIDLEYADVRVEVSETDEYKVAYSLPKGQEIDYSASNGKLVLKTSRKGMFVFGDVSFFSIGYEPEQVKNIPQAVICVPKSAQLTNVDIKTESGNVDCQDIHADNVKIMADYGDIRLQNIQTDEIQAVLESGNLKMKQVKGSSCEVENEYGNIAMEDVEFVGDMDIKLDSGDVSYQNSKMRDLVLENSYGQVSGQQIKLRNLRAELESCSCTWKEIKFNECKIESEYGDINFILPKPLSEYEYDLKTDYGRITIDGETMGEAYHSLGHSKKSSMIIRCESGDIDVR